MKRLMPFLILICLIAWCVPALATATGTITVTQRLQMGTRKWVFASCPLSASYSTGGDTVTAARLGLGTLEKLIVLNPQVGGYQVGWASTTSNTAKIQVYGPNGAGVVSAINKASYTDIYPYAKASIVAADDIAGTTAFSTVAAVMGANSDWISATAAAATGVAATIAHQPDIPRNITFCCHNINGGTVNSTQVSWAIVGTYNGAAQTETVVIPGSVSMANGKMILKSGAKPFDSVTSVTPTGTDTTGFQTQIGIGGLVGLSRSLYTPAESDVQMVTQTAVPVAISSITSTTNNTIKFATITANDYLFIKFATKNYNATPTITGALAEASGDLSGTTVYFIAIGT